MHPLQKQIFRRAAAYAAGGAVTGGAAGYALKRNDTEPGAKRRKITGALRGAVLGGAVGMYAGMGHGIYKVRKDYGQKHGYDPFTGHKMHVRPNHKPYMGKAGLSGNEKTKVEAVKKYREMAMRHHPDRPGGSHEKMREVNDAWANIKGSAWFDKLGSAFAAGFLITKG